MGRRTKYDDTFPARARQLARDGLVEEEIAKQLGISVSTLNSYKTRYPAFLEALKEGKAPVDEAVESALLQSALGYDLDVVEEEYDGNGNLVKRKNSSNHVKPNPTSLIFWLKNRRPDKWRDKQDVEMSGDITVILDGDDADV